MKKLLILISIFTLTTAVSANEGPSWNFISAGYHQADIDGFDGVDPTGFGISGSALLGEDFVLFAGYSSISDDILGIDVEVNGTSVGLGYRFETSDSTDFIIAISYENVEACGAGYGMDLCIDDNGYGALVGIKSMLSEKFELTAGVKYVDIADESDTALSITGSYYFSSGFSLGLNLSTTDDVNMYGVVASIVF